MNKIKTCVKRIKAVLKEVAMPDKLSISRGNTKLGNIPNFSLPPLITCPGFSKACAGCYNLKGMSYMFGLKSWSKNLKKITKNIKDLADIILFLRKNKPQLFRIHCSGDFYSRAYIKAWIAIAKNFPKTLFFAYTRSWRKESLIGDLRDLKALPNVRLWASTDKFTGSQPEDFKSAYMQLSATDLPPYKVDLFFRVEACRKEKAAKINKIAVCPVENGFTQGKKLTCIQCGICFR